MIFFPDKFAQRIFLCGIGIQLILSSLLPISLSADSYQYLRLAYTPFNISDWDNRPFGYPLFLKLALFNSGFGLIFIIFFQTILSALMPNILYSTFYKQYNFAAKFVAIMFLIYPYYNFLSLQVMTDTLFIFLLLLCIYFIFQFFRDIGVKNLIIVNLVIFIAASVRPSAQILFLAVPGTIFLYFLFNFKSREVIKIFLISVVLGFGTMQFYSSTLPEWGKSFGSFINYYKYMSSLCLIEDIEKINKIKTNNSIFVPDDDYFYLIENTLEQLKVREQNKFISNNFITQDNYFSEKCFSTENNLNSNDYLLKVEELLEIDPFLEKQLTHYYDVKLSPTDELNPMFANLSNSEIVKLVHNKVIHGQPYIFIYFSMARNYGFDETNKIVKKLVRSMYSKLDNGLLINALESNVYKEVIIRQRLRIFNDMENLIGTLRSTFHIARDMNFWRFTFRPKSTIEEKNANYLYSINPKIFAQSNYSLFKSISPNLKKDFDANPEKEYWNLQETYMEDMNKLTKFNYHELLSVRANIEDKSVINLSLTILMALQTLVMSIFSYWMLYVFVPIYLLIKITLNLKNIHLIKKNTESLAFFTIYFSGLVSICMHFFLFGDQRHYMFHEPHFLIILVLLINDFVKIFKKYKKRPI